MWSPYGKQLPLEEVDDGLRTELPLGPEGTPPIGLKLMKSPDAMYFDLLLIDFDRDGEFGAGESLETTPTERNHRFWSSFDAVVDIPVVDPVAGEEAGSELLPPGLLVRGRSPGPGGRAGPPVFPPRLHGGESGPG
jgi:hypothetical protein